jgi:hypothetical protein
LHSYWRLPRALLALENPFLERGLFYPVGAHTVFNTNTPLLSVLSYPVQLMFGLTGASIVVGGASVVVSGWAMYALVRRVGCSRPVAFFGGVAFALLPWRTNRLITHMNLIHTEFTVFAVLAVLALLDRPTRVRAALLGVAAGAAVLTDLATATMAGLAVAVVLLVHWRQTFTRVVLSRLAVTAVTALVLALPILVPLAMDVRAGEAVTPPGLGGAQAYSTDVLSWVLPYPKHPLWGARFEQKYETTSGHERFAYIGIVVAGLAVVGALTASARRRLWLVLAGVFGVLSFGPALHLNGWTGSAFEYDHFRFSIPMPYLLLHQLPFIGTFRAPARFASVAGLALIVLAALGLERITRRMCGSHPALAVVVPLVATVLVGVEFLPPTSYLTLDPAIDAAYPRMRDDPSPGAVLDIPLQFRHGFGEAGDPSGADHSSYLYAATVHERPMSGGSAARLPEHRFRALQEVPVYHDILRVQGVYGPPTEPPTFTLSELDALGIRFVVYHRESAVPAIADHLETLGLERYSSSSKLIVWKVPS